MAVLSHVCEVVAIADVEALMESQGGDALFTEEERRYSASKTDPGRRLAARWAAKLAAARAFGGAVSPQDVEVVRGHGAPRLRFSARGEERLRALGSPHVHVSLTHGLTHAAASVVLETAAGGPA